MKEVIIDELLAHGRSPEEPAALILRGTLPTQPTIAGSLHELQAVVRDAQRRELKMPPPSPCVHLCAIVTWWVSRSRTPGDLAEAERIETGAWQASGARPVKGCCFLA